MIISTTNPRVADLLASVCLRMPADDGSFSTAKAKATAKQLDRLASVLCPKHAGEWTVASDTPGPALDAEELHAGLDGKCWQAFMSAPMFIGADTDDLLFFLENVYRQPVHNENYMRVAQLFRLWYAATAPAEYHEPVWRSAGAAGPWFNWRYPTPSVAIRNNKRRQRWVDILQAAGWSGESEFLTAIGNKEVIPPHKS